MLAEMVTFLAEMEDLRKNSDRIDYVHFGH